MAYYNNSYPYGYNPGVPLQTYTGGNYTSPYSNSPTMNYNPANQLGMASQPSYDPSMNDSINWVQGEAGASAYPIARGATVLLMDANPNSNRFYIKRSDPATGRPLPLEKYRFERVNENQNEGFATLPMSNFSQDQPIEYVPKTEFDTLKEELDRLKKTIDELTK